MTLGSDLFHRMLAFEYEDDERARLMEEVWTPTPWMIDAFVGRIEDGRERKMLEWCFEQFGEESSPIHKKIGSWHRGNAIVFGWGWFGFATEEQMRRFIERWPEPAEAASNAA